MEEVATTPKDQSSDHVAPSKEFDDLKSSSANENGGIISQQEIKDVQNGVMASEVVESEEMRQPSPDKIEIGNSENLADPQLTLDEASNDETANSNGLLKFNDSDSQSCAVFNRISYLGSASVNAPHSESELQKNMSIFNRQSSGQPVEISLSIPSNSDGCVILHEAESSTEIARHPIRRITFLARGPADTSDSSCFAFTSPQEDSEKTALFQCHVFRCEIAEVLPEVMRSLLHVFRKPADQSPLAESTGIGSSAEQTNHRLPFEITLEIREEESAVPKDLNFFKIRAGIEKKIVITVVQVTDSLELPIERCSGLLVSPGRHVKHTDMHLLATVTMEKGKYDAVPEVKSNKSCYVISGHWNPNDPVFGLLNRESSEEMNSVDMTVAVDLVIRGISEPVRFVFETSAKVHGHDERFLDYSHKQVTWQYALLITEVRGKPNSGDDRTYRVTKICFEGEIERPIESQGLGTLPTSPTPVHSDTPKDEDLSSDDDEPLPSGSGGVSKDEDLAFGILPENRTVYCSGLHPQTKVKEKEIVVFGSEFGRVLKAEKITLRIRRKMVFTGKFSVTFEKETDAQKFYKQENPEFKDQRLKLSMKRVFETAPPEGDSVLRVMFGIPQTKEEIAKGMKSFSQNVFYVDMESGEQAVVFLHGIGEADRVAEIAAEKPEFLVNGVFCFVEVVSDDERDTLLVKLQARLGEQASPAKKPRMEREAALLKKIDASSFASFTNATKK